MSLPHQPSVPTPTSEQSWGAQVGHNLGGFHLGLYSVGTELRLPGSIVWQGANAVADDKYHPVQTEVETFDKYHPVQTEVETFDNMWKAGAWKEVGGALVKSTNDADAIIAGSKLIVTAWEVKRVRPLKRTAQFVLVNESLGVSHSTHPFDARDVSQMRRTLELQIRVHFLPLCQVQFTAKAHANLEGWLRQQPMSSSSGAGMLSKLQAGR